MATPLEEMTDSTDLEALARKYVADTMTEAEAAELGKALESMTRFPVAVLVEFPKLRLTAKVIFDERDGMRSIRGQLAYWDGPHAR